MNSELAQREAQLKEALDQVVYARRLVEIYRTALNRIAAWNEGDEVTESFDEPAAARTARAALNQNPYADTNRATNTD